MRVSNIGSSQIEVFAALVDRGGFSEAARHLGLTQSAVSHALARLETELGAVLVERGRRGVVLTPSGRAALPHVREALARLEAVRQAAVGAAGAASGKLRLGLPHALVPPGLLSGAVAAFTRDFPGVELVLTDGTAREVEQWLVEGVVEAGLMAASGSPGRDGSLAAAGGIEVRPLFPDELCALVPAGHPLAAAAAVTAPELLAHALVVPRFGAALRDALLSRRRPPAGEGETDGTDTADAGFPPRNDHGRPPVRHQVNDAATLVALVRDGVGAGVLPRRLLPADLGGTATLALSPAIGYTVGLGSARPWAGASPAATLFAASFAEYASGAGRSGSDPAAG